MTPATLAPSVVIREAALADVPHLAAMAGRFLETPAYRGRLAWEPARLAQIATDLLGNPDAVIFVAERDGTAIGLLALHVFAHPMSGERIASEVVWWVDPDARGAGVRLLRAAEAWTRTHGAQVLQMIAPDARVGRFYAHVGYEAVETVWQRRVT